jgi:hypothetical protein
MIFVAGAVPALNHLAGSEVISNSRKVFLLHENRPVMARAASEWAYTQDRTGG